MYRIHVAIIQQSPATHRDKHILKSQFGFRKEKNTADAIYLIRRIAEVGKTANEIIRTLLD